MTIPDILNKLEQELVLSPEDAVILLASPDPGVAEALQQAGDRLRQQQVGPTVTYVINRNINFTNICEQHCNFCAFRRDEGEEGAFWLNFEQIKAKAQEAVDQGATEICMQGGLNPQAQWQGSTLNYYVKLVETIKQEFPQLHLHAFSPQEIEFIARMDHLSYEQVIKTLQSAGLGSLPGTAAEILDDSLRQIICPEKLKTAPWLEIVSTAHRLGLCTTSTMLCGQLETPQQQVHHLLLIKQLQEKAQHYDYPGRITEFILLPFVGESAPVYLRKRVGRDQPDLAATLKLTAVARILLQDHVINHQPSWVKLALSGALDALNWGCNDLGGTLMEEHITTMAGAKGGTSLTASQLTQAIASIGRLPQQRTTLYQKLTNKYQYFR